MRQSRKEAKLEWMMKEGLFPERREAGLRFSKEQVRSSQTNGLPERPVRGREAANAIPRADAGNTNCELQNSLFVMKM